MSRPISDYAIIGDTHTTALIARDGSIDWLCWPRHDSPALFLRLLDDERGGACSVAFDGVTETTRDYLPDTNVIETSVTLGAGRGRLTDFMPVNPPTTVPDKGPDGDAESRLIRIVTCDEGEVVGRFVVRPTFDYARVSCTPVAQPDGSVLFESGEHRVMVTSSRPVVIKGETAIIAFRLTAGERMHLVLTQGQDGQVPPVQEPDGAVDRLRDTTRYWRNWLARCTYDGPHAAAVRRSALFLKLMTYSPSGAIIAAPTIGLPEAVPGNRNFDYRYAWLRDASFTVTAFANLGYRREAQEYLRFLCGADESHGSALRVMYGIDGSIPDEEELGHLSGWRGVKPVTVGNAAADQVQHDIYGELLLALEDYLEAGDEVPTSIADGLPELVCNLAKKAMAARGEPDQGIWEPRGPAQHFLHTKALIWVALDRAVRLAPRLKGIDPARCAEWKQAAAEVRDEYLRFGWNEERGSYVQAYGSDALDASVLRIALFDALPLDDGRLARTVEAVQAELGAGDLLYRYRVDDGMEGDEGTFTACAFWMASCLALVGQLDEAKARLERLLARSNDVGLFAEEIDASSGEQRGNFPQGFTHMAVINHSVRLAEFSRTDRQQAAE